MSLNLLKSLPSSFIVPSFDISVSLLCTCVMLCDKHSNHTIRVQSSYTKHCVIGCISNCCQDYHQSSCILVFLFGESHLVFQLYMPGKIFALASRHAPIYIKELDHICKWHGCFQILLPIPQKEDLGEHDSMM